MSDREIVLWALFVGFMALSGGFVAERQGRAVRWGYVLAHVAGSSTFVLINILTIVFSYGFAQLSNDPIDGYMLGISAMAILWTASLVFPNPFKGFDDAVMKAFPATERYFIRKAPQQTS